MSKWKKEQYSEAMQQIDDADGMNGFLDYAEDDNREYVIQLVCQRNALLEALKDQIANCGECDPSGTFGARCGTCDRSKAAIAKVSQ